MRKHQDIRARFTRKLLQDTLFALLAEKRFEMITVGEIAERAMVNRATFYRHYQDKYELATACFKKRLINLPAICVPHSSSLQPLKERG